MLLHPLGDPLRLEQISKVGNHDGGKSTYIQVILDRRVGKHLEDAGEGGRGGTTVRLFTWILNIFFLGGGGNGGFWVVVLTNSRMNVKTGKRHGADGRGFLAIRLVLPVFI